MCMQFRKVLALRGPNIWANSPVLEAWVDLQELKDTASNAIPGFNDRLMAWLPSMIEHECSEGHRGGFFVRLREGTYPAHILEHVTLELQCLAGTPVGYGRARESCEPGVYKVVVKYKDETLARACLESARELILAALYDRPYDAAAEIKRLRDLAEEVCPGPSPTAIVDAAGARGIPVQWLNAGSQIGSLVQMGQGLLQRRILAARTDETSSIAEAVSQDKELTKTLLRSIGVPVPEGRPVADAEDAWAAAREVGTPVVVKPRDADYGHGVAVNLINREQVLAAYAAARERSDNIIVERYARGAEHRLLVVDDRLVAAVRREPPHVVGDGRSTIVELLEEINRDPRRGDGRGFPLRKIPLDSVAESVLAEQGFTPDSVPAVSQHVLMRRNSHRRDGGASIDVTDQVHPEVAARARDAARVVGLNIAGIDIVVLDIGRPLEEQGGVLIEVNAEPALRMHVRPSHGQSRPVGEAIVASLFPEGETGRIPLVAVSGVNGKTTTTRLVAHILRHVAHCVGMTCTDGIYINDRRIESGDCAGPKSARAVLLNRRVNAAVLECARGGILREGLGFDRCSVGVVTNIGEGDHLGLGDVHTPEKLAQVKRTIVDVVLPEGAAVLNAGDPLVAAMAPHCKGSVIYFARDGELEVIVEHRLAGGRAVIARDGAIVLAEGPGEQVLMQLADVPLTHRGRIGFQVENVLAAAAAAWALQLPFDNVRAALASFQADMDQVPGRFNLLQINGATVLVDFGHNASALEALAETLELFPQTRRAVVFSADGDRRDDAIVRQAAIIGRAFDRVILYEEDVRRRGRAEGEIIKLVQQGLAAGGRASEIEEARGELAAVERALRTCRAEELVVVLHDAIDASLAFIREYMETNLPQPANYPTENRVGRLHNAKFEAHVVKSGL